MLKSLNYITAFTSRGRCVYNPPPLPACGLLWSPQVFFTRNGKLMGRREMAVPPGGLYPTVGMLSNGEKVKVDLHPLSG